jgi:hypothetical protein
VRPANEGFTWCSACYAEQRSGAMTTASRCVVCGRAPSNPDYDLCQSCFSRSRRNGQCTICHSAPANVGYAWCQRCYHAQSVRGGSGSGSGGGGSAAAAAVSAPREDATYEELLAWEESRGRAGPSLGMSQRQLSYLPRRPFLGERDALKGEQALCSICQMDYEEADELILLPACAHTFHADCLSRWLVNRAACPCCMRDVRQDLC